MPSDKHPQRQNEREQRVDDTNGRCRVGGGTVGAQAATQVTASDNDANRDDRRDYDHRKRADQPLDNLGLLAGRAVLGTRHACGNRARRELGAVRALAVRSIFLNRLLQGARIRPCLDIDLALDDLVIELKLLDVFHGGEHVVRKRCGTKGLLVGHVLRLDDLDGVARFIGRELYKALRVGNDVSTRLEQRFENCHRHILVVFDICCATNQNRGLKIRGGIGLGAIVQDLDQTFIGKLRLLSAAHHRSIHTARSKRRQAVGKRGIDWHDVIKGEPCLSQHTHQVHLRRGAAHVDNLFALQVFEALNARALRDDETPARTKISHGEQRGVDALRLAENARKTRVIDVVEVTGAQGLMKRGRRTDKSRHLGFVSERLQILIEIAFGFGHAEQTACKVIAARGKADANRLGRRISRLGLNGQCDKSCRCDSQHEQECAHTALPIDAVYTPCNRVLRCHEQCPFPSTDAADPRLLRCLGSALYPFILLGL